MGERGRGRPNEKSGEKARRSDTSIRRVGLSSFPPEAEDDIDDRREDELEEFELPLPALSTSLPSCWAMRYIFVSDELMAACRIAGEMTDSKFLRMSRLSRYGFRVPSVGDGTDGLSV